MKEAKKYINHHKVKLSGKWYITKVRASEAVEIAFEEGRISAGKENQTRPLASLPLFPAKIRFRQTRHVGQARPGCRPEPL